MDFTRLDKTILFSDVFSNPDDVVRYANSLEFVLVSENYAGARTENLKKINKGLYDQIGNLILGQLIDFDVYDVSFDALIHFQKVKPNGMSGGFIHIDELPYIFLCYLTKEDQTCGTDIWRLDDHDGLIDFQTKNQSLIEQRYTNDNIGALSALRDLQQSFHTKVGSSSGAYNTGIAFNGKINPHSAVYGPKSERLTLVAFFEKINISRK